MCGRGAGGAARLQLRVRRDCRQAGSAAPVDAPRPRPQPCRAHTAQVLLSDERFKVLDQLLNRTGMFTQFLKEQLEEISNKPAAPEGGGAGASGSGGEPGGSDAGGKKGGGKRKGAAKGGAAAKRAKAGGGEPVAAGVSPTQVGRA